MSKKVYIAGDMLPKASQLLREKEREDIKSIGLDFYNPMDNKEINDKANVVNEGLAERIVRADTDAIKESDIIVIEPQPFALGTLVELGQIKGMRDFASMILELNQKNENDDDFMAEVIHLAKRFVDKKIYPHYEDVRRFAGAGKDEEGDRRSLGINQYVYGVCLDLTDGKGFYEWDEVLEELEKFKSNTTHKLEEQPLTNQVKKEDETIIIVKRGLLFDSEYLTWQGATKDENTVKEVLGNINSFYIYGRRGSTSEESSERNAELNFQYKQPIPYMVVKRGNQFFVTERLAGGGESRLHGKLSMGIGGHMNPLLNKDGEYSLIAEFEDVLRENTMRELEEEIKISNSSNIDFEVIGLINDDSNDVGKVHLGILGFIELDESAEVTVREVEQLAGHWYTLEELRSPEVYDRLENWGKIVVDLI